MARLKTIAEGTKDLFKMDPRKLTTVPGWNVRVKNAAYEEHIQELMGSIREVGVLEPLTIYTENDVPIVTNGHCRLDAVMRLIAEGVEIKTVLCCVEERGGNEADRILSMLTRNSGLALSPLEQSEVVKRLLSLGWEVKKIADRTGKSQAYVNHLLDLREAPEPVLQMVRDNQVSASTAVRVVKKEGGSKATETLTAAHRKVAACGGTKVTPKHLKSDSVNWGKSGPEVRARILALRGSKDLHGDVNALISFVESL